MLKFTSVLITILITTIAPATVVADADGPDFYRIVGVAPDDVLNIRAEPSAASQKIGEIPHDGDRIQNRGCIRELSFQEWQQASEEDRKIATHRRWCEITFNGIEGWVAGRFLVEGSYEN